MKPTHCARATPKVLTTEGEGCDPPYLVSYFSPDSLQVLLLLSAEWIMTGQFDALSFAQPLLLLI